MRPRTGRMVGFALSLTLAVAALAIVIPAVAAGRTIESYSVPNSGQLELRGHGFGHGIGMSQFGAQGMGLLGKSYRQILSFYYPGTSMRTAAKGTSIRVALSRASVSGRHGETLTVGPSAGLRIRMSGHAVPLPGTLSGQPVTAFRVSRSGADLVVRAVAGDAGSVLATGHGPVVASTGHVLGKSRVKVLGSGGSVRSFHGDLQVKRGSGGLLVVDNLLLEHYVRSVVSAEVPGSWTAAALQAQAVAARSYALLIRSYARASGQPYDICDTTSCQAFGSISTESSGEVAAVKATAGQYLSSGGLPALTQFSASNGGWSVAGSRPYLVGQSDPYDGVVGAASNWGHSWRTTLSANAVENAYPAIGHLQTLRILGRDGNGDWGGRIQSLALVGSKATATVSGDSFRMAMGLKSTWWVVTNTDPTPTTGGALPAPQAVRTVALDRSVRVSWHRPSTGRVIKAYRIAVSPGGAKQTVAADRRHLRVRGLINGVNYTATVKVLYRSSASKAVAAAPVAPTSPESYFRPVRPRPLVAATHVAALSTGRVLTVRAAGVGQVPLAGTRAVLLRVTAGAVSRGSVVAYRTGSASKLTAASFAPGTAGVGTVAVPVDGRGRISLGVTTTARRVSATVLGYFTVSGLRTWNFHGLAATRVVDSSTGLAVPAGRLHDGTTAWVKVAGRARVPTSGVRAVIVNTTLTRPRADARVSYSMPGRSFGDGVAVSASTGVTRTSTAVVRLDDRGRMPLRFSGGAANVTVDVLGWFGPHDNRAFGRYGMGGAKVLVAQRDGRMSAGETAHVIVTGRAGVPATASSVMLLVRAYGATSAGSISVRPVGSTSSPLPAVTFDQHGATRNLVTVPVGRNGKIEITCSQSASDVDVRVVGWYS